MIAIDRAKIAEICRRHHIRELALFGSALREDFSPQSDVDLLYEFEPGHAAGFEIVDIEAELSATLGGRRIDLVPRKYLNRHLRDRVLATASSIYVQG